MELNDTARVRRPVAAFEHRLGTIIDIHHAPFSTYVRRCRLRFPTGDERTYRAEEIRACTRDDDHAALLTAFTGACRSLRDACRIAHDHDAELSAEVAYLLSALVGTAGARLGVILDPVALPETADQNGYRS